MHVQDTIRYKPDGNTNLYGSVRDIFDQLLAWHLSMRTQGNPIRLLVTLFCDGEHTPDENRLFREARGQLPREAGVQGALIYASSRDVVRTIIEHQHDEVRLASRGMLDNRIDVQVIGFGVSGEAIAANLGLTREHGTSVDANANGMERSIQAVTDRVQSAMKEIVFVGSEDAHDD